MQLELTEDEMDGIINYYNTCGDLSSMTRAEARAFVLEQLERENKQ